MYEYMHLLSNPDILTVCKDSLELEITWKEKTYESVQNMTENKVRQTVIHVLDTLSDEIVQVHPDNITYRGKGVIDIIEHMFQRSLSDPQFNKDFFNNHLKNVAAKRTKEKEVFKMDVSDFLLATNTDFAKRSDKGLIDDIELMSIKNLPAQKLKELLEYKVVGDTCTQDSVDRKVQQEGEAAARKFILESMTDGIIDQKLRVGNCMVGSVQIGAINVLANSIDGYNSMYPTHGTEIMKRSNLLSG